MGNNICLCLTNSEISHDVLGTFSINCTNLLHVKMLHQYTPCKLYSDNGGWLLTVICVTEILSYIYIYNIYVCIYIYIYIKLAFLNTLNLQWIVINVEFPHCCPYLSETVH